MMEILGPKILLVLLLGHIAFYLYMLVSTLLDRQLTPSLDNYKPQHMNFEGLGVDLDIVIPARNEGMKIGRCLESLEQQTFKHFKVWMVNDRSIDETEAVMQQCALKDDRFHLIEGVEPPVGWVGKVNAIAQAWPNLSAKWVLFLDADTWLHPENLERALGMMTTEHLEMLSLIPTLECETFWERVILPGATFFIALRYPGYWVNDPKKPNIAIANGQYLLFDRAVYERLGRHEAVKGSVVEDLDMSRLAKKSGVRYRLATAVNFFRVRMYTNFAELREGWTKNMYFADKIQSEPFAVLQTASIWSLVLPVLTLPLGYLVASPWWLVPLSWVALGVMYLSVAVYRYLFRLYPLYTFLHPLTIAIIAWFFWESRRLALSEKGVTWKGRHYRAS